MAKTKDILIRLIFTEKALRQIPEGVLTFEVDIDATKPEIKKEIEEKYGKKVKKVRTAITRTKKKLIKKAYVRFENPEDAMEIGRLLGLPI